MILALDVGGTKIDAALVSEDLKIVHRRRFSTAEEDSVESAAQKLLNEHGVTCRAVCAGVAGPVRNGSAQLTNIKRSIDEQSLGHAVGAEYSRVINDVEASAWGALNLQGNGLKTLKPGEGQDGNKVLLTVGTGFGHGIMFWDGENYCPSASEGGHVDFGPACKEDVDLLDFLFGKYDHVSWERIVSGKFGFLNLYEYLSHKNLAPPCSHLSKADAADDFGKAVFDALGKGSEMAQKILQYFLRYLGAQAGNLALTTWSVGGVYIAGGVANKLSRYLTESALLEGFNGKGRMSPALKNVPIYLITDHDCAVKGAAACARHGLSRMPKC